MAEWKSLSHRKVYENPWIEVSEHQVLNPNGGSGIYGLVHFKNLAIGIIAVDADKHTWLVGQRRFPLNNKLTWEIVEGGGPTDLDPLESAKRELREEAGLVAEEWRLLQEMDLSNSATDERAIIYLAQGLREVEAAPDDTELLQVKKVPLKSVLESVLKGDITDSLSVAGILRLYLEESDWFS